MGKWYQYAGPRDPRSGVERIILEYGANAEPARFLDKGGEPKELSEEELTSLYGEHDLQEVDAPEQEQEQEDQGQEPAPKAQAQHQARQPTPKTSEEVS